LLSDGCGVICVKPHFHETGCREVLVEREGQQSAPGSRS